MRKKSIKRWWDYTFWYIIYMFPVIVSIVASISCFAGTDMSSTVRFGFTQTFDQVLSALGFDEMGVVGWALYDMFDINNGLVPLVGGDLIYRFANYFVSMVLVHLAVDFILFIPRFAHKLMDKCYQDD